MTDTPITYILNALYDAIQEAGEDVDGLHFTIPFTKIYIELDIDFRIPDIELPSYEINLPKFGITFDIDVRWLQLLIPGVNITLLPQLLPIPVPFSQYLKYDIDGVVDYGYNFDPVHRMTVPEIYMDVKLVQLIGGILYGLFKLGLGKVASKFALKTIKMSLPNKQIELADNVEHNRNMLGELNDISSVAQNVAKAMVAINNALQDFDEGEFTDILRRLSNLESLVGLQGLH